MKTTILGVICTMLLVLGLVPSAAQKKPAFTPKDLPAAVTAAFAKAYPNAKIVGADTEVENGKTLYEVESLDGKTRRDFLYLPDGTVFEMEEVVAAKTLPEAVTAALAKEFKKFDVEKAEKLTRDAKTEYELTVETGKKLFAVSVDAQGKILSKKEIKEQKKEGKKEGKNEKEEENEEKD